MDIITQYDLPKYASFPTGCLDYVRKGPSSPTSLPPASTVTLKITIVGAGLGGLATAIALARRGHQVSVFEQVEKLGEIGAGIQLPSNSSRLLLKLGVIQSLKSFLVEPHSINLLRRENGSTIGKTPMMPDFINKFGAPYYVVHRAHLHSALLQRARDLGVAVHINSRVMKYEPSSGTIVLQNGISHTPDPVVAADRIQSRAVACVTGQCSPNVRRTAFAAYRATVKIEKIKADSQTAQLLKTPDLTFWLGDRRHVMTYPIARGTSFNMVLSHPDPSDPATWKQEDSIAAMKRDFRGWDPRLLKIIDMIDATIKWPLMTAVSMPNWIHLSSRLLLLGDAAHAMLPYMSQGAGMAIEDGAALAEAMDLACAREDVGKCLELWQRVRIKRTRQMQQASLFGAHIWRIADGPEQVLRDEWMRADVEGRISASSPNMWSDAVAQRWCYGYDAEREIEAEYALTMRPHL